MRRSGSGHDMSTRIAVLSNKRMKQWKNMIERSLINIALLFVQNPSDVIYEFGLCLTNLFSVCSVQGHANNISFARAPRPTFQLVTRQTLFRCDSDMIHWPEGISCVVVSCLLSLSLSVLGACCCKSYLHEKCHDKLWIFKLNLVVNFDSSYKPTSSSLSSSSSKV